MKSGGSNVRILVPRQKKSPIMKMVGLFFVLQTPSKQNDLINLMFLKNAPSPKWASFASLGLKPEVDEPILKGAGQKGAYKKGIHANYMHLNKATLSLR